MPKMHHNTFDGRDRSPDSLAAMGPTFKGDGKQGREEMGYGKRGGGNSPHVNVSRLKHCTTQMSHLL